METIGSQHEEAEDETPASEWSEIALPGFRFHPTEEELVGYYLRRMVQGRRNNVELIASLDLYQYDPWELPAMAFMGEKEWFFFCPRDKKYPNGARPNRVTASGYWKATGTDRPVRCSGDSRCIGLKKTLVFYTGRAPRGNKTEWIMNEYRMPKPAERSIAVMTSGINSVNYSFSNDNFLIKNDVALCRIYRKSSSTFNSFSFLSAINGRDLEERTCRMMVSRFENNQLQAAVLAENAQQQQQQEIEHSAINQGLQVQTPTASVMSGSLASPTSTPAEPLSNNVNRNVHLQQTTAMTTSGMVSHDNTQLVNIPAALENEEQQQKLDCEIAAQRKFEHGVSCSTTSQEASRQLQTALRTAMAKLDGMAGVALGQVHEGELSEPNGPRMFARLRNHMEDAIAAVECPSASREVTRSPSSDSLLVCTPASASLNHDPGDRMSPLTNHHHPEDYGHQLNFCSRDPTSTLLRKSSSFDNIPGSSAAAFNNLQRDLSCCSSTRISIPSSFSQHHETPTVTPSATGINTTSGLRCTTLSPRLEGDSAMGPAFLSINRNNSLPNSSRHLSATNLSEMELEDELHEQGLSMPPLTNASTFSGQSKLGRFSRGQQFVTDNYPMAKVPLVAEYWRQSSCATRSPAAAGVGVGVASISQLNPFDALSGVMFQYEN
ncbi:hypothetical protein R1sor_004961 [Riccia sorocarpa]|uniref:NAC domain-containing protein n=1 Tax=Riccia sorocarpa TaxID=122646 RepID=A0ABD3HMH9_9MARC